MAFRYVVSTTHKDSLPNKRYLKTSTKLSYFNFEEFPCKFVPQVVDEDSRVVKVVPQSGRVNVEESQLKEINISEIS